MGEGGDVFFGVVQGEGGAGRAGDAETCHEGLAAMVAGADGDAHLIDQGAEIVVMDAFDGERDRADSVGCDACDHSAGGVAHSKYRHEHEAQLLGWEPQISLEEGLAPTYRWIHGQVHGVEEDAWTRVATAVG